MRAFWGRGDSPGWPAANVEAAELLLRCNLPEVADEVRVSEHHLQPHPPPSQRLMQHRVHDGQQD